MKSIDPKDQAQLKDLHDRVVLTLEFMSDVEDLGTFGTQLRAKTETAFGKGDLRTMRLLAREVDSLTVAMAPHQREGLEALLKARLGVDKDAERSDLSRRVASVIQRGTIASEKERRKLEEYIEMLEATGGDPAEAEAVRQLLKTG